MLHGGYDFCIQVCFLPQFYQISVKMHQYNGYMKLQYLSCIISGMESEIVCLCNDGGSPLSMVLY